MSSHLKLIFFEDFFLPTKLIVLNNLGDNDPDDKGHMELWDN